MTKVLVTCTLEKQRPPRGATPHSWRTRGAEAERGLGPEPGPATRALPKRGGASTGEEKEKGDYGELQLAVCKRKYEGAEVRHGGPKPAAANANHLAYELVSVFIPPRGRGGLLPPQWTATTALLLLRLRLGLRLRLRLC